MELLVLWNINEFYHSATCSFYKSWVYFPFNHNLDSILSVTTILSSDYLVPCGFIQIFSLQELKKCVMLTTSYMLIIMR